MKSLHSDWLKQRKIDRLKLLEWAGDDVERQEILRAKAKRDPVFFINQFCWTYDPRLEAKPHHHPFILYDFQEDYIKTLEESYQSCEDLLTDKSRDMGATWMVLSWMAYHWLFDKGFTSLVGSRKEDMVDNKQLDSLFGKVNYLIERLPRWLGPEGWDSEKHYNYMRIINPENGNAIQGESANENFSRQGRYSVILLDEYAFWAYAGSVWTATADSAPTRLVLSTPCGKNNKFARLRFSAEGEENIRVKTLHWRLHPLKDDEWYARECKRRRKKDIAQELDLDYEASGNEKVFEILRTNSVLRNKVFIPSFKMPQQVVSNEQGKDVVKYLWNMSGGLDYGTRNCSAFTVYARDYDGKNFAIWEWRKTRLELMAEGFTGSMVHAIHRMLVKECPYYDCIDDIYADPSLWTDNQNTVDGMTSIARQLINLGIYKLRKGAQSDKDAIERVLTLFSQDEPAFKIFKDKCPGLTKELEELLWDDWSEALGEKKSLKEKIIDKDNHSWDTLKYFILSPAGATPKPPPTEFIYPTAEQRVQRWQEKRRKEIERRNKGMGCDPTLGKNY